MKQTPRMKIKREHIADSLIAYRIREILEARQANPEAIKYYLEDVADTDFEGFEPKMFTREWALVIWIDFQTYVDECQKAELEYIDYKLLLYAIG